MTGNGTAPAEIERSAPPGDGFAHLVLKPDWPVALCGYHVREFLGTGAPAMDRCPSCLQIAAQRDLGRPGWER